MVTNEEELKEKEDNQKEKAMPLLFGVLFNLLFFAAFLIPFFIEDDNAVFKKNGSVITKEEFYSFQTLLPFIAFIVLFDVIGALMVFKEDDGIEEDEDNINNQNQ